MARAGLVLLAVLVGNTKVCLLEADALSLLLVPDALQNRSDKAALLVEPFVARLGGVTETRLARPKQRSFACVDVVMNVGNFDVPVCALGSIEHLDAAPTRLCIEYLPKCIVIFGRSKAVVEEKRRNHASTPSSKQR
ncbi:hypothetical protein [Ralstonia pseudosolanacearum]|uniref:hypothetical protein n=1 Tax=Ralstonia pseudosolanacearum TaxID=1310165 RepID=UPI001267D28C|nr:hypothetical protein [Ralstonia pseudosolanacearum]